VTDERPFEVLDEGGVAVKLPSGATSYVLTDSEREWLSDKIERYLEDNHFKNVSDMLDIDKLVMFELMVHRWSMWVSKGKDYYDEEISVSLYAGMVENYSKEVRLLKKSLGVDKSTRDRVSGDDSVAARWANVLQRAKEFGYMRNRQALQAIESMHRIASLITVHRNMDENERKEFHFELSDILEVIEEEVAVYKEIDEDFRHNVQSYWIRDM
jgi:hypothetical protein